MRLQPCRPQPLRASHGGLRDRIQGSPKHQGPKTFLQVAPGTVEPGTTWEVLTSVMPQADSP